MDFRVQIAQLLQAQLAQQFSLSVPIDEDNLSIPPTPDLGDYAYPCFPHAKALRLPPARIAETLAAAFPAVPFLARVEAASGYLNFFLNPALYAQTILTEIHSRGSAYGSHSEGQSGVVCLDYSSINITKQFHIGHLMTTAIGNALKRIYAFCGYKTVSINHLGDWGTQFGKQIVAYKLWGDEDILRNGSPSDAMKELTRIYVKFHVEAETHPELETEARAWFKRIEDGEPEATSLFMWFKDLTLRDAQRIYDLLDVHFDSYNGESFYNDKMEPVLAELREKSLLVESQGAYVVDLEPYGMPPCLLLKSDGATLYATRDLATAIYRKDTYNFVKSLYVVAQHQELHFRQFFKVLELMGRDFVKDMEHVSYGMVSLEDGAMATRKGNMVLLEDLLNRSIEKTRSIMLEKNPELVNLDAVAQQVGVGAVVFQALLNNRSRDLVFSWERALNFDGETGPYVNYTHARCCSVLAKSDAAPTSQIDAGHLADPEAMAVLRLLERFPRVVLEACHRNEPSLITRHAVDIAQAFNHFYYEHRILDDDAATAAARLCLTDAVRQVLATSLNLLGIAAPERM